MAIKIDVLNFEYDDAEPAFTEMTSGYYYHRVTKRLYGKASFDAWMTAHSLSFGTGELGDQSTGYKANHLSIASRGTPKTAAAPAPTGKPITISVTKAPAATNDDTGTVTVAGGPADKAYTVTLTVKGQASAGDDVQNVAIAKGDTAAAAAGKIAAASSDPNVTAVAAGAVITFTPKAGTQISKLTVSIA